MELNKNTKQGFSILQSQISESESNYILITNKKIIFNDKVFIKEDKTWVNDNESELKNILLYVGLNQNKEVESIKNENDILKKKIEELELKIEELEEEEIVIPKKKISGKPADQEKISKTIIKFFNDNKANEDDISENFDDFSVTLNENKTDKIEMLKEIFGKIRGKASEEVYKSLIELALLYQLYLNKYGEKIGKKFATSDLDSIITTTKKSIILYKKANNFYFICKHLKKGAWKECKIAPTYWKTVTNVTWNNILEDLNLKEQQNGNEGKVFYKFIIKSFLVNLIYFIFF